MDSTLSTLISSMYSITNSSSVSSGFRLHSWSSSMMPILSRYLVSTSLNLLEVELWDCMRIGFCDKLRVRNRYQARNATPWTTKIDFTDRFNYNLISVYCKVAAWKLLSWDVLFPRFRPLLFQYSITIPYFFVYKQMVADQDGVIIVEVYDLFKHL